MINVHGRDVQIVAEVKIKSPTNSNITGDFRQQLKIAQEIADAYSIHTMAKFGGSLERISEARETLGHGAIIVAKGMHPYEEDVEKGIKAGATNVLVVLHNRGLPKVYQERCWIEPLNLAQLRNIPDVYPVVVWNERDIVESLAHGREIWKRDTTGETFEQARRLWGGKLCQASGLRTVNDIKPGADYVLVGSYLKEFADSLRK
jgi:hypothetical protein